MTSFQDILGAYHLVKNSGISGSAVNGTRLVGSSHWKTPRKSRKSKKVGPFSRLEFPNGSSRSILLVSRSLYQFQVHGKKSCRTPRRTGVYHQMEQLFTSRKFHFCSHRNFRVVFLNGKRPISLVRRTLFCMQQLSQLRPSCVCGATVEENTCARLGAQVASPCADLRGLVKGKSFNFHWEAINARQIVNGQKILYFFKS